jgi:hypothetical protein
VLDGRGWARPLPGRFTPGRVTRYLFYRKLNWPQGRSGRVRKISPPPGFDPWTVQHLASYYIDWAIPVLGKHKNSVKNMRLYQCMILSVTNTCRHLLVTSFLISLQSILRLALTTLNTTENKCVISHHEVRQNFSPMSFQPVYISLRSQKGAVGLHQGKPLPRSTANSSVSNSTNNVKMCRFYVTNIAFPFYS